MTYCSKCLWNGMYSVMLLKKWPPSFRNLEEKAVNWIGLVRRLQGATEQHYTKLLISVNGENETSFVKHQIMFLIFTLSYHISFPYNIKQNIKDLVPLTAHQLCSVYQRTLEKNKAQNIPCKGQPSENLLQCSGIHKGCRQVNS